MSDLGLDRLLSRQLQLTHYILQFWVCCAQIGLLLVAQHHGRPLLLFKFRTHVSTLNVFAVSK